MCYDLSRNDYNSDFVLTGLTRRLKYMLLLKCRKNETMPNSSQSYSFLIYETFAIFSKANTWSVSNFTVNHSSWTEPKKGQTSQNGSSYYSQHSSLHVGTSILHFGHLAFHSETNYALERFYVQLFPFQWAITLLSDGNGFSNSPILLFNDEEYNE